MKRSPFFFMRQQAGKRLQSYLGVSFVLLLLATAVGSYGWQMPQDTTVRSAILSDAKPADEEVVELIVRQTSAREQAESEEAAAEKPSGRTSIAELLIGDGASAFQPNLPASYDRFDPTADLLPGTELQALEFSTEVTDRWEPVSSARVFAEGFYTLYATFGYNAMADGMEWAWVWRHNGDVVDGGNELWKYGDDGPGYIYLSPEAGFQEGQYSLEIWVNGELLSQGAAIMNDAAVAAGN